MVRLHRQHCQYLTIVTIDRHNVCSPDSQRVLRTSFHSCGLCHYKTRYTDPLLQPWNTCPQCPAQRLYCISSYPRAKYLIIPPKDKLTEISFLFRFLYREKCFILSFSFQGTDFIQTLFVTRALNKNLVSILSIMTSTSHLVLITEPSTRGMYIRLFIMQTLTDHLQVGSR